jgi:hypothetical protein
MEEYLTHEEMLEIAEKREKENEENSEETIQIENQ